MWKSPLFLRVNLFLEDFNGILCSGRFLHLFFYLFDAMHYCGMISVAYMFANHFQGSVRHVSAKVHGDLAGENNPGASLVA